MELHVNIHLEHNQMSGGLDVAIQTPFILISR